MPIQFMVVNPNWSYSLLGEEPELLKTINESLATTWWPVRMDLADATLVVLVESQKIRKSFTLDHKDFKIYKPSPICDFSLPPLKI